MLLALGDQATVARVHAAAARAGARVDRPGDHELLGDAGGGAYSRGPRGFVAHDGKLACGLEDGGIWVESSGCGGRSTFAWQAAGAWVVSSSLGVLARVVRELHGTVTVDAGWLAGRLAYAPFVRTESPYREVLALPAATRSELSPGASARFRAIAPPVPKATTIADVEDALDRVVRRYAAKGARSAVLTGGIDSCVIAGLVAQHAPTTLVCADVDHESADRPYVELLAAHLGVPVELVEPREVQLPDDLTLAGAPLLWPMSPHIHAMFRRARHAHATSVLTGLGGDELFEGTARSAGNLLRKAHPLEAAARALATAEPGPFGKARALALDMVWSATRAALPMGLRRAIARVAPSEPCSWMRSSVRAIAAEATERARVVVPRWEASPQQKIERVWSWEHLDIYAFDGATFEHESGLPRLDPYLDPELVTAWAGLPEEDLRTDGVPRAVLRNHARARLPERVRTRRDKAWFEPALCRVLGAASRAAWKSLGDMTALADLELVEPKGFAAELAPFLDDPAAHPEGWLRLWPALACEAFVRGVHDLPGRFTGAPS